MDREEIMFRKAIIEARKRISDDALTVEIWRTERRRIYIIALVATDGTRELIRLIDENENIELEEKRKIISLIRNDNKLKKAERTRKKAKESDNLPTNDQLLKELYNQFLNNG